MRCECVCQKQEDADSLVEEVMKELRCLDPVIHRLFHLAHWIRTPVLSLQGRQFLCLFPENSPSYHVPSVQLRQMGLHMETSRSAAHRLFVRTHALLCPPPRERGHGVVYEQKLESAANVRPLGACWREDFVAAGLHFGRLMRMTEVHFQEEPNLPRTPTLPGMLLCPV